MASSATPSSPTGSARPETDAYYAAFFVPDLLNYLLSGGALSITFIPLFARYLQEGDAARGWRLLSNVVTILGGALLVATAAAFVSAPTLIAAWYPDFDAAQVELTVKLTRIVLFGPLFFLVGGLLRRRDGLRALHRGSADASCLQRLHHRRRALP